MTGREAIEIASQGRDYGIRRWLCGQRSAGACKRETAPVQIHPGMLVRAGLCLEQLWLPGCFSPPGSHTRLDQNENRNSTAMVVASRPVRISESVRYSGMTSRMSPTEMNGSTVKQTVSMIPMDAASVIS